MNIPALWRTLVPPGTSLNPWCPLHPWYVNQLSWVIMGHIWPICKYKFDAVSLFLSVDRYFCKLTLTAAIGTGQRGGVKMAKQNGFMAFFGLFRPSKKHTSLLIRL